MQDLWQLLVLADVPLVLSPASVAAAACYSIVCILLPVPGGEPLLLVFLQAEAAVVWFSLGEA